MAWSICYFLVVACIVLILVNRLLREDLDQADRRYKLLLDRYDQMRMNYNYMEEMVRRLQNSNPNR